VCQLCSSVTLAPPGHFTAEKKSAKFLFENTQNLQQRRYHEPKRRDEGILPQAAAQS
jgi:hypothetical protein